MRDMRARTAAAAVALVVLIAAACRSTGADPHTTTTTGPARPTTSTTTTTLGITNDPAFHTRRSGVLTVATDHLEPPYFVVDPTSGNAIDGYEYDVARALAARLGLGRVRVVRGSLDSISKGFDCGCDVFLGGVAVTDALARRVDLSVPYVQAGPAVLMRAGTLPPTAATAPAMRWGLVATDDQASVAVNERVKPVVLPRALPLPSDVVRAVAAGEIDAGVLPAPLALLAAKADPTLVVVGRFDTSVGWAAVEPLGSANSPSLNDLMDRMVEDGTMAFISRLHLGADPATLPILATQ
jgi:ABC-type amino acid transport substrate-binding protein